MTPSARRAGSALSPRVAATAIAIGLVAAGCSSAQPVQTVEVEVTPQPTAAVGVTIFEADVVARYPHDSQAYTQGLEFVDGVLLESTGLTGQSTIRLVEPTTGEVLDSALLPNELYGEGATVVDDQIYQLTWKDEILLVHSLDNLAEETRVSYSGEGWGLCATDQHLIMSDGSDRLTFRHRQTFEQLGSVQVTSRGEPLSKLNELECVGDRVWANIWQSNLLVSIDPETGVVDGEVDLSPLVPDGVLAAGTDNVTNGIAYNRETGRFWLTGKRWPVMYEVELQAIP